MSVTVEKTPPDLEAEVERQIAPLRFQSALDFIETHPTLAEPIVDGLFRRGETVNVIGSTKQGKSWMILGLALSIADGRDWLGRATAQGRVALIDNELQPGTLSSRIKSVANAMMVKDDILRDNVVVLPLRGNLAGLNELYDPLEGLADQGVVMVALDAFYRFIPTGLSENDNAAMTGLYNTIDDLARKTGAAFVLNHHSSKGSQADKRVTDVGSGAGSISRAADTHMIIREHQDDELAVLDAACRSFPPIDPTSLRFEFPLWSESSTEPELKRAKGRQNEKQEQADKEADNVVRNILRDSGDWMCRATITRKSPFGPTRVNRALFRLAGELDVMQQPNPKNKSQKVDCFRYDCGNDPAP
ncbi:helicase RepA family protein [Stieleria sp. ICT_E10.1]|uniref:AAA family ATPase n=1 Tax=Stieleria sedimenti TaxID=2976331 RepID=UPI00217FD469|nr:helicase RepA family protein [Stieleria sedimenti]MCS7466408.1 helicase RepA family protein [Stieleria sedimenti]